MQALLPETGFVRLATILKIIPVGKTTWWAGVKSGRFPEAIKLGERTTALREKYPNTKIEVCPNNNLASIKEARRCFKIAKVEVLTSEEKPCF